LKIDVATLLRVKKDDVFYFDSTYRPLPLYQQYIGISEKKALKRLELMNDITYTKLLEKAGEKQVLVFVHSRKDTAKTAKYLRDKAVEEDKIGLFLKKYKASQHILAQEAENVSDSELKNLLPYGFGIHHAGLSK
jgi:pre-mRNA-splicing helicase BRR2